MFGCADSEISVIVTVTICGLKMGLFSMEVFMKDRKLWFGTNIGYSERLRYMTVSNGMLRFVCGRQTGTSRHSS
jgi:hypothetical protein